VTDDPINYGDGIDWYRLHVRITNKGTAASGAFTYVADPVWGQDMFSGQQSNEARAVITASSLAPGEQRTIGSFYITKRVVDNRTWGVFLDNNGINQGTVIETKETNNHCTFWANPS